MRPFDFLVGGGGVIGVSIAREAQKPRGAGLRAREGSGLPTSPAASPPESEHSAFRRWGSVGIRAQFLDLRSRSPEMDFLVEGDDRSMHVLNAVSPGWTCAFPFARYVVDRIEAEV